MVFSISLLLCLPSVANDAFTLYLVRHAEKQASKDNPRLTQCGQLRAQQLSTLLEKVNLQAIYSTSYQRTMSTAQPSATRNKLAIKQYAPNKLAQLALQLKLRKQNALIVGHSNTTPALAELLSEQTVESIPESEYQMLYQIQFNDEQALLTVLKQPLSCF